MTDEIPPEESAQYDEIDEKTILMDIAAQLDAIRRLLEESNSPRSEASQETVQFRCKVCDTIVIEDELASHAESCFNWHESIGEEALKNKYERIIE